MGIIKTSFYHLVAFIIILLLFNVAFNLGFIPFTGYALKDNLNSSEGKVKIANWNLQIFGDAKSAKQDIIDFYISSMKNYDIIFIQEIRDFDESSFQYLCSFFEDYSCLISSRAGRTTSKEQYGIIYKKYIDITLTDYNPDQLERWERPPIKAEIKIKNYTINVYNIHTKTTDVLKELAYLEDLVENNGNVMILGDLNADCDYYNAEKETQFDSWYWIVSDESDTTISSRSCAYDRIILNENAFKEYSSRGIQSEGITPEISDHYMIWVELNTKDKE